MKEINNKYDCCGCGACSQACPHSCISMRTDNEGFFYPETDSDKCTNCGLCEKICPMTNPVQIITPEKTLITHSSSESIREKGSSGGMFYTVAKYIILNGGIVFGARFDKDWNVVHDYTDTLERLSLFCGSKYLQSDLGDNYKQTRRFLEKGKTVLFTGTPCQIHGLKKYLKKDYDNLLTIDCICHGVPSPMIWQSYLDFTTKEYGYDKKGITGISFRDKCTGWKSYSLTIKGLHDIICSTQYNKNTYMQLFLKDLILRPSCYNCRFKGCTNASDITLGDFWGVTDIHPEWDDDKGLSVFIANTSKGAEIISKIDPIQLYPLSLRECIHKNPSYDHGAEEPSDRTIFWSNYRNMGYNGALKFLKSSQPSTFNQLKYRIKIFFHSLMHHSSK